MNPRSSWKPNLSGSIRRLFTLIVLLVAMSSPASSNGFASLDQFVIPLRPAGQTAQRISGGDRTATVIRRNSSSAVAVTAVRNLEEVAWLERLEIEVKNISARPVYYLLVQIIFPDFKWSGSDGVSREVAILLSYGRWELQLDGNVAGDGDVPIKPQESYILRIPESDRKAIENELAAGTVTESAIKKFGIMVDTVIFGDGTGFKSGQPTRTKQKSSSQESLKFTTTQTRLQEALSTRQLCVKNCLRRLLPR